MEYTGLSRYVLLVDEEADYETIPPEFFKITLVDEIIGDFFEQYHLPSMLNDVEKFNSPVVVPYKSKHKTYEGTLFNYRSGYPRTVNQLTVSLSHDGFRYKKLEASFVQTTKKNRNLPGWMVVNNIYLQGMSNLKKLTDQLKAKIEFLYHPQVKRIDIEFVAEDGTGPLKLCFEHGYGKNDDRDEYLIELK